MNRLCVLAILCCARLACAAADPDAAAIQDFGKRVAAYAQLRKQVQSGMPALRETDSPGEISRQQNRLADALRRRRANAQAGDIFTPQIAAEFRRLIALSMETGAKQIDSSLRHAEPVQLRLHVNESYPDHIPLQSTPPSLLANLPPLPSEIEYRIAGRDLILLDTRANLVIDLIANCVP